MKLLSNESKAKVMARIESCDFSPFPQKLASNISKTYGSLAGRDIKVWAQVAVYILMDVIPNDELEVWIHLSDDDGTSLPPEEFPSLHMIVEWLGCFSSTGKIHPKNLSPVEPGLVSVL